MNDERNHIDNVFREGLDNFTPPAPPDLWATIESEIQPGAAPAVYRGYRRILWVAVAVLVLTAISLWLLNRESGRVSPPNAAEHTPGIAKPKSQTLTSAAVPSPIPAEKSLEAIAHHNMISHSKAVMPENGMANSEHPNYPESSATRPAQYSREASTGNDLASFSPSQPNKPATFPSLRSDFIGWLNALPAGLTSIEASSAFNDALRNRNNPYLRAKQRLPLIGGVVTGYDNIDYGNGNRKHSMSAGFTLQTFKGAFTLETGVAIALSTDNGRYLINYRSWDSLGYYNRVVSFSPNPQQPGSITFNTVVEGVYDSIGHSLEAGTNNRYTYLQIPLMAGYRIYADRIFTIGLKAGPVFSLMLRAHEPGADFSLQGSSLQSIHNLSPVRVSTDWQMSAALSLGMRLSQRFTFELQPVYKTYLRPVYQNLNTKPQSIGIRAVLLYRF